MKKEISTEIMINASPEKIWRILSDFNAYSSWNPFIKWVKGDVAVGNKISVRIEPPGAKAMVFNPKVLVYEPNKEIRWLGHFLLRGIFDGEHSFKIIDHADGTSTFQQAEKFKGILVSLLAKQLDINTKQGFNEMNQKLKQLAEGN